MVITSTQITEVKIPAIGVDVGVSGGILPGPSPLCKGSARVCYDPPDLTRVAWGARCALPSLPSTDTVCLFGHSNRQDPGKQVFNDLPDLRPGDDILVRTDAALFTYRVANNPVRVSFDGVKRAGWVWAQVPNRLVAMTCEIAPGRDAYSGASIVEAFLVSVQALG
jgi:hypothetical protein